MSTHPSIELNGHTVFVRKIEPLRSVVVLSRMQKSFITPLVGAMSAGEAKDPKEAADIMMSSIQRLSDNLTPGEVELVLKTLIDPAYVSIQRSGHDAPVKLDEGTLNLTLGAEHLIDLVAFIVEVNWKGFLVRITTLITEAKDKQVAKMQAARAALAASSETT